jgi:transposase
MRIDQAVLALSATHDYSRERELAYHAMPPFRQLLQSRATSEPATPAASGAAEHERGRLLTLIAALPELGRLSGAQIGALVGVVPIARDSGRWKGRRWIQAGRFEVRRVLYMATLVATCRNERIRAHYQHLLARGKAKKLALVACMRKLLTILNTLIKNDVLWRDEKIVPGQP